MSDETAPEKPEKLKKKEKRKRLFSRKRPFEENYDAEGNFVPRKRNREEVYSDYYGPLVVDAKGNQAGKFFFKEYEDLGRPHIFGELILGLLFIAYFAIVDITKFGSPYMKISKF